MFENKSISFSAIAGESQWKYFKIPFRYKMTPGSSISIPDIQYLTSDFTSGLSPRYILDIGLIFYDWSIVFKQCLLYGVIDSRICTL